MLNFGETFDTKKAAITHLAHSRVVGKFGSKNILQHLKSEQACIDLIQSICQHLQNRGEYGVIQNLQIGLTVWSHYFQVMRTMSNNTFSLSEIQIPYSDTIQTAISYINTLQIEDGEDIKQEIFAIISQS